MRVMLMAGEATVELGRARETPAPGAGVAEAAPCVVAVIDHEAGAHRSRPDFCQAVEVVVFKGLLHVKRVVLSGR